MNYVLCDYKNCFFTLINSINKLYSIIIIYLIRDLSISVIKSIIFINKNHLFILVNIIKLGRLFILFKYLNRDISIIMLIYKTTIGIFDYA